MITTVDKRITFNPNVERMQPSATLAVSARAKELRRQGRPVISLSAGEPDFDTPAPICEAGIRAIREGFTHYTVNAGMLELREEIAKYIKLESGIEYLPDEVLCSNGAKQSVALALFVLCRPDDEVIIPAPYWVSYPEMVRMAGATPVPLATRVEDGYLLRPEDLEGAITERTRAVILCSPSNPTGAVYKREQLKQLAAVLEQHEDIFVVSDEIYEQIVYDTDFTAFASLPGMRERTVTVNGFSKGFAMTGWRLGFMAAERSIVAAAAKVQGQFTSAPSSITQKAGIAALTMDRAPVLEMVQAFRERRDFMVDVMGRIPDLTCPIPEGAFYLFPDVSAYFGRNAGGSQVESSSDLAIYLMEQHNVALVPGEPFGAPYGIRLSYAASMDDLQRAAHHLVQGFAALS